MRLLDHPIMNRGNSAGRFSRDRWTSRLGLERANEAAEIILKNEPKWRPYDALLSDGLCLNVSSDGSQIARQDFDSPEGRAWLVVNDECRVRVDGANGLLFEQRNRDERYFRELGSLIEILKWQIGSRKCSLANPRQFKVCKPVVIDITLPVQGDGGVDLVIDP